MGDGQCLPSPCWASRQDVDSHAPSAPGHLSGWDAPVLSGFCAGILEPPWTCGTGWAAILPCEVSVVRCRLLTCQTARSSTWTLSESRHGAKNRGITLGQGEHPLLRFLGNAWLWPMSISAAAGRADRGMVPSCCPTPPPARACRTTLCPPAVFPGWGGCGVTIQYLGSEREGRLSR